MNKEITSVKQRFGIISTSPLFDQTLETALRVSPTDLTVLITGESGVGKEAFSKIIHAHSPRKHNPFIAINCGAIPEGTINSELFGHEKGAFTGATGDRKGYFETVNGGTIFLDEVGEMPLDTQAYLLRILESGEFIRVGSSTIQKTDVRIIAATNVDLRQKIRAGKFREDLYYRLNTVPILIPPLRERKEDILLLFRKFSSDFAEKYRSPQIQLDEQAKQVLSNYAWPGNVRELKNMAEQISVLSKQGSVSLEDLQKLQPQVFQRSLPVLSTHFSSSDPNNMNEREILYKLLFEMKSDLNDLKKLVFELIRSNDLQIADQRPLLALTSSLSNMATGDKEAHVDTDHISLQYFNSESDTETEFDNTDEFELQPLIVKSKTQKESSSDILINHLSLEDMEKDMIRKALQRYRGKRKDAADELGISERTLYRKIKQYDL
jgi:transcriptional regulator with PAS, ATPase and Fis domain